MTRMLPIAAALLCLGPWPGSAARASYTSGLIALGAPDATAAGAVHFADGSPLSGTLDVPLVAGYGPYDWHEGTPPPTVSFFAVSDAVLTFESGPDLGGTHAGGALGYDAGGFLNVDATVGGRRERLLSAYLLPVDFSPEGGSYREGGGQIGVVSAADDLRAFFGLAPSDYFLGTFTLNFDADGRIVGTYAVQLTTYQAIVPEPASLAMTGLGLAGVGMAGWRRRLTGVRRAG